MKLWRKFCTLFTRRRLEREMAEEMEAHLDELTERNIAQGMSPKEARYAAQRAFGGVEQIKERARDVRSWVWIEQLGQDLRYGLRQLRNSPGFTMVAVLTLAIGIGLTTSIFSVVSSIILKPLPYPKSDRLVSVTEYSHEQNRWWWSSGGALHTWQNAKSFAAISSIRPFSASLVRRSTPVRLDGGQVLPGYFQTYGIEPLLGRGFSPPGTTTDRAHEIILNHRLWTSEFGAQSDIVGQRVQLDGEGYTVVGVMPENFQTESESPSFYLPLSWTPDITDDFKNRRFQPGIARLKDGVSVAQARAELTVISERIARKNQATNDKVGAQIMPLLDFDLRGSSGLLYTLLGAVGFLLLIACVNVANLLLARGTGRQREIAVRIALGAGRKRIVRQLLAESVLLSLMGGVLGLLFSTWSLDALMSFAPMQLPRRDEVQMDGLVFAFGCVLTLLTGVGFGLLPALQVSRINLTQAFSSGTRQSGDSPGRTKLRHALVAGQIALALMLLTGTGLLGGSFLRLLNTGLGYDPDGVVIARIQLLGEKYPNDVQRGLFVAQALEQLLNQPDIVAAAFTTMFPHNYTRTYQLVATPNRPDSGRDDRDIVTLAAVTPDYFKVLGNLPLLGRSFIDYDRKDSAPVVIVSESVAGKYWPDENPIGQRIALTSAKPERFWREVVGVVRDVKLRGPAGVVPPQVYLPFAQQPGARLVFAVRKRSGGPDPTAEVATAIHAVDPDVPVPPRMIDATELVAGSIEFQRFAILLFAVFSSVALILAALGIYGVMTYAVSRRTNEIGVRMALGAQPANVLKLIFGQALRLIGFGLIIGIGGSLITAHLLQALLYETSPTDPLTLFGVSALLCFIALLACWLPARRAAAVDPMVALRSE